MTSFEQVLHRVPSRTGDDQDDADEAEGEDMCIGVALTTSEEQDAVGIAVVDDERRDQQGEDWNPSTDGIGNGNEDEHGGQDNGEGDVGEGSEAGASRRSSGVSGPRLPLPSRSRSNSNSRSRSQSPSPLHSHSRSRSSVRGVEMGESSAATSWTQADPEGGRPSGEERCRSREGGKGKEEEGDEDEGERARVPRDGTGVVSLSRLRANTSTEGREGGEVSRKEEVLVVQEEDIGEGWHPLRYGGKARSQDEDGDDGGEGEEGDLGSVHALESTHGDASEEDEKERWRTFGSSRRNGRDLRLKFKAPSPQPWEEVDPLVDNNETYASDYYSTLNSKKFETLQKSRRRPLIPRSTYYYGPPPPDSAYGTAPVGHIGIHHPREIVRIERDYAGGELVQFSPVFPLELEGRITPTQFHQTINDVNEILISAHSIHHAFLDNFLAVVTLQLSTLVTTSHYTKEMRRLKRKMDELNTQLYNPVGLHILWPQKVAFLFLEIEYYASRFRSVLNVLLT